MMPSESTKGRAASDCGAACAEQVRYSPILEGWLRIATRGLCEAAVKRIQSEVSAHYWEIVDSLQSQDLPEEEAKGRAIERLGDPAAARRGFQKTYLAGWQAHVLFHLGNPPGLSVAWPLEFYAIHGLVLSWLWLCEYGFGRTLGSLEVCVALVLYAVCLAAKVSLWVANRIADIKPGRRRARKEVTAIGWAHDRWPKATAGFLLLLCIPYGWAFQNGAVAGILCFPLLLLWMEALGGVLTMIIGRAWSRPWLRDTAALAFASCLLFEALTGKIILASLLLRLHELEQGIDLSPFFRFLTTLFLFYHAFLTLLGAWLARKRGNEPPQAAPEPVRDDVI